jgi:3-hydroxyacyl-CoA dehydrogenase
MAPAIDTDPAEKAESLKKKSPIAVVGTGLVGAGWAIVFARVGHAVHLFDSVPGAAERAIEMIQDRVVGLAEHQLVDSPESILENLSVAHSLESAVEDVVYVQESVFEQVEAKTKVMVSRLLRTLIRRSETASATAGPSWALLKRLT